MRASNSECNINSTGLVQADITQSSQSLHQHNICAPIKTLSELWSFLRTPPDWVRSIIHLASRSTLVIKNDPIDCHVESQKFIPKVRLDNNFLPKTIVCHDMKNGYLEDKYVGLVNIGNGYSFYQWSQIDIFIYFSHHLISIPPLSWINVAHKNGVAILGTFITEWDKGKDVCNSIFQDIQNVEKFANALIDICILFKLDGWFINIENKVTYPTNLKVFVKYITSQLHEKKPGSKVIWYDSVTADGELKWQNELNNLNSCYFDVCDGIFLNYGWEESNLERSIKAAQHRILDVYVGLDVFGRGVFGGGKFNSHLAAEVVRKHGLSLAIFGQGWTHETLDLEPQETFLKRFYRRDNAFWKSLWPYLYTHPVRYVFETFFHTGVDKDWFILEKQGTQLSRVLTDGEKYVEYEYVATLKDNCHCLQLRMHDNFTSCLITNEELDAGKTYVHHLFSCEIQVHGSMLVYIYTKDTPDSPKHDFTLILLIQDKYGCFKKIACHSNEHHLDASNPSIIEINSSHTFDVVHAIRPNDVPKEWHLRCFHLNCEHAKILEIGLSIINGDSICLCGLGIRAEN